MTKTNYQRGAYKEGYAIADLRKRGYVCTRSAGSHGPWDITAVNAQWVRLIQVKSDPSDVKAGLAELRAVTVPEGVTREVWLKVRGGWKVDVLDGS
jgi:hypothetical protein